METLKCCRRYAFSVSSHRRLCVWYGLADETHGQGKFHGRRVWIPVKNKSWSLSVSKVEILTPRQPLFYPCYPFPLPRLVGRWGGGGGGEARRRWNATWLQLAIYSVNRVASLTERRRGLNAINNQFCERSDPSPSTPFLPRCINEAHMLTVLPFSATPNRALIKTWANLRRRRCRALRQVPTSQTPLLLPFPHRPTVPYIFRRNWMRNSPPTSLTQKVCLLCLQTCQVFFPLLFCGKRVRGRSWL